MNRFLFIFGYESPVERDSNQQHGTDFESSKAVWISAANEEEAMSKGRFYANDFVATIYRDEKKPDEVTWSEAGFAYWISKKSAEDFPGADLTTLNEI